MQDSNHLELPALLGEAANQTENAPQIQPLLTTVPRNTSPPTSPARALSNDQYQTAVRTLSKACNTGDLNLLNSVFAEYQEGLDPNTDEETAQCLQRNIVFATTKGYADIVSCLLDHGADLGDAPMWVTQHSNTLACIGVLEAMFKHGLDLKSYPGILHTVIKNEALLIYLLSKGADPNGLDNFDNVPLQLCNTSAEIGILLDYGADMSRGNVLHEATGIPDNEECIRRMDFLLQRGADINARAMYPGFFEPGSRQYKEGMRRTGNEGTALHWAVRGFTTRGRTVDLLRRVKWLLEKGADVSIQDNMGHRPADYTKDQAMRDLFSPGSV